MPRGIKGSGPKLTVKTPAHVTPTQDEVQEQIAPVFVGDAGAALHKDRSGKALNNGLTEGRDNFQAITDAARSVLNG